MEYTHNPSRRNFIKISSSVVFGFTLEVVFPNTVRSFPDYNTIESFQPNAWLTISKNNTVTIMLTECEMGQGVMTSLPMLVAEELAVDWNNIRIKQANLDPVYGWQGTGGSTSIRDNWTILRKAGAAAREMLINSAAILWKVPSTECRADNGKIHHLPTGRNVSFGELVDIAVKLPIPKNPKLKSPSEFKLIGKSVTRLDLYEKVNGKSIFGIDVSIPNMLIATITHCPYFDGNLLYIDAKKARNVNGVKHIIEIENGIAVVADNFWSAQKAQRLLDIKWDPGPNASLDDQVIYDRFRKTGQEQCEIVQEIGNLEHAKQYTIKSVEQEYFTPFQAHATMEPMCCTAHVHDNVCELWVPTQQPSGAYKVANNLLLNNEEVKTDSSKIIVNTTLLGGGFGRRNIQDFVSEAVQLSQLTKSPIKLIWSREEDIQHDYYHPATYHKLKAYIDENGLPIGWHHCIIGTPYSEGAKDISYEIPNIRIDNDRTPTGIPLGPWRSVAHSYNAFAIESFIDELSVATNNDPLEYRLNLLKGSPRLCGVLERVAEYANWGNKHNRYVQGLAVHKSFGSYVAQIVELNVDGRNNINICRVICAVDCGIAVHPDTIKAQIEGSIAFALTATLKSQINIKNGRVKQSNFHDFPLLRINEMPKIDILIVNSHESPGGIGEPAVPPVAPAVANALFFSTGKRYRTLPFF